MEQLALFDFCAVRQRFRQNKRCKKHLAFVGVQLCLELKIITDPDDEEDELVTAPIIHRIVSAESVKPLEIKAPTSIFNMGANVFKLKGPAEKLTKKLMKVERIDGLVKCTQILEQDTLEWREREEQRRARQKPPKPGAKYKTMGKKLQDLTK